MSRDAIRHTSNTARCTTCPMTQAATHQTLLAVRHVQRRNPPHIKHCSLYDMSYDASHHTSNTARCTTCPDTQAATHQTLLAVRHVQRRKPPHIKHCSLSDMFRDASRRTHFYYRSCTGRKDTGFIIFTGQYTVLLGLGTARVNGRSSLSAVNHCGSRCDMSCGHCVLFF